MLKVKKNVGGKKEDYLHVFTFLQKKGNVVNEKKFFFGVVRCVEVHRRWQPRNIKFRTPQLRVTKPRTTTTIVTVLIPRKNSSAASTGYTCSNTRFLRAGQKSLQPKQYFRSHKMATFASLSSPSIAVVVVVSAVVLVLACPSASLGAECVLTVSDTPLVSTNSTALVDKLWEWCVSDADCREVYHQMADAPNRTVFYYLLQPSDIVTSSTQEDDLVRSVACASDVSSVNRALWIRYMIAKRKVLAPLCDINHELRFDATTLQSTCVCRPDRVCTEAIFVLWPYYVAITLATLVFIASFAGGVYKNVVLIKAVRQLSGDEDSGLVGLFNALK